MAFKNLQRKGMAFVLTAAMAVSLAAASVVPTQAATNKAVEASFSMKNTNFEKSSQAMEKYNHYTLGMETNLNEKVDLTKAKVKATVYIPKSVVESSGANFTVGVGGTVNPNGLYQKNGKGDAWAMLRYEGGIENGDGKVSVMAYDAKSYKGVKGAKYGKLKSGTGDKSDYYVLSLKNVPFTYIDSDGTVSAISGMADRNYYIQSIEIGFFGQNQQVSSNMYVDDVTLTVGGKKKLNFTFDSEKTTPEGMYLTRGSKDKKAKVVEW